jgi:hypothetical protein
VPPLTRRAPSPRRGEGWGEGARTLEKICGVRTPSPSLRSTSPLWGEVKRLAHRTELLQAARPARDFVRLDVRHGKNVSDAMHTVTARDPREFPAERRDVLGGCARRLLLVPCAARPLHLASFLISATGSRTGAFGTCDSFRAALWTYIDKTRRAIIQPIRATPFCLFSFAFRRRFSVRPRLSGLRPI